jgi:TonB family protein
MSLFAQQERTLLLLAVLVSGCIFTVTAQETFTDPRNRITYKTVWIGGTVWMAENLKAFPSEKSKAWCYNDSVSYCDKYGMLYDWKTAQSVCPNGYRLPSNEDWDNLVDMVKLADTDTGVANARSVAGKKLSAKSGWQDNNNGTDNYGFAALPGGELDVNGKFRNVRKTGGWWTSTEGDSGKAYYRSMSYNLGAVRDGMADKRIGYSVRCVRISDQEKFETNINEILKGIGPAKPTPKIALYIANNTLKPSGKSFLTRKFLNPFIESGKYKVIDRSDIFTENATMERIKQRDGSVNEKEIRKIGEEAGAQYICMVELDNAFGRWNIAARLVDVVTAEVYLRQGEKDIPGDLSSADFSGAAKEIFDKIHQINDPLGGLLRGGPIKKDGTLLSGGRDRASIQKFVNENIAALKYAYSKRLREKPGLAGKITVKFAIDEFGKVLFVKLVESTVNDSELETTVIARVKGWQFEKIDKPGDVTEVTYPFVFGK